MTEMKEITLTAIYEEAEEGGYIGYVAELPGANTQGETLQETRENLVDAVMLILETNREEAERRLAATAKVGRDSEGNKRAFGLARCLTMKRRDLLRYPEAHGCVFLREGARHTVYKNLANGFALCRAETSPCEERFGEKDL